MLLYNVKYQSFHCAWYIGANFWKHFLFMIKSVTKTDVSIWLELQG